MPASIHELTPKQPENHVNWVYTEYQLSKHTLPQPTLEHNRYLLARTGEQGNQEVAVGIVAIPPEEPPVTGFWAGFGQRIRQRLSPTEQLPATPLRIEQPIDYEDAQRGLHTPLSAMHPHVVMENGTHYGVQVFVPSEWVGKWSDPQERDANEGDPYSKIFQKEKITEIYRRKQGVALLIRLNGDTPLVEQQKDLGITGLEPSRSEMLIGVPEQEEEGAPFAVAVATHRQVVHARRSLPGFGEQQKEQAEVSDLEFRVVAERGAEENATLDNRGLVEVIVVRCVEDEVVEKIVTPSIQPLSNYPFDSFPGGGTMRSLSFGDSPSRSFSLPDSTRKGETQFTNVRREKVSVRTVRDTEPVARFKLALVGPGGPIQSVMEEAPEPSPES